MKSKPRKIWLYWWSVDHGIGYGEFVHSTYSTRLHSASRMQAYDKESYETSRVGPMHKMRVEVRPVRKTK